MKRILLLYASFGDGHVQVANALEAALRYDSDVNLIRVDCFRATNRLFAAFSEFIYEKLTRWLPALYGLSYTATARLHVDHFLWSFLAFFTRKATWQALEEYEPDLVLQVFPDHALRKLPENLSKKPQIGVILTDFSVHSRWFHSSVDFYVVPSERLIDEVRKFVNSEIPVLATGIPLRIQFNSHSQLKNADLPRLRSVPRPYVVILTGGRGVFPDLIHVIQTVLHSRLSYDVCVLCGRNDYMRQRVQRVFAQNPRVHAIGYVDSVANWLKWAEFAIVKAGGITVSECLAMGCPMVFYRPLAGQEGHNAKQCEKMGTGFVVKNIRKLEETLQMFEVQGLSSYRSACQLAGRPDATNAVVAEVLHRLSIV